MFGGYGIYCDNIIFAIIFNNELYFKADKDLAKDFASQGSVAFTYESKGKVTALSYWKVPIDIIEDDDQLKIWFDKSMKIAMRKGY